MTKATNNLAQLQFESTASRFNEQAASASTSQQLNFIAAQNEAWRKAISGGAGE
jgi:hypothetical protein